MEIFPFVQADLLQQHETCDRTEGGVCVALCDYWIWLIKNAYDETPEQRLTRLGDNFVPIMNHQRQYSSLRQQQGPRAARQAVAGQLGSQYDGSKTTVMRSPFLTQAHQLENFRSRLGKDIGAPGEAATWSLRFSGGGGHAIAGFCGLTGQQPILHFALHLFDPNIGEYVGELSELDDMLDDLLTRFPLYHTVESIRRTGA